MVFRGDLYRVSKGINDRGGSTSQSLQHTKCRRPNKNKIYTVPIIKRQPKNDCLFDYNYVDQLLPVTIYGWSEFASALIGSVWSQT